MVCQWLTNNSAAAMFLSCRYGASGLPCFHLALGNVEHILEKTALPSKHATCFVHVLLSKCPTTASSLPCAWWLLFGAATFCWFSPSTAYFELQRVCGKCIVFIHLILRSLRPHEGQEEEQQRVVQRHTLGRLNLLRNLMGVPGCLFAECTWLQGIQKGMPPPPSPLKQLARPVGCAQRSKHQ